MRKVSTTLVLGALVAAGLSVAAPASAAVVDFQNLPVGSCSFIGGSAASGGFTFTAAVGGNSIFSCDAGVLAQNTSRAIVSANGLGTITFAPTAGGTFALNAFDAGSRTADFELNQSSNQSATGILVEGLSGANVIASTSFTFNGFSFSTFTLSNAFSGLTSARITPTGPNVSREFVLDNVRVNEAFAGGAVPEPATWAMLFLGFGGLGYTMRRKRQAGVRVRFA